MVREFGLMATPVLSPFSTNRHLFRQKRKIPFTQFSATVASIFLGGSPHSDSQVSIITPRAATRADRPSNHQSCRDRTAGEPRQSSSQANARNAQSAGVRLRRADSQMKTAQLLTRLFDNPSDILGWIRGELHLPTYILLGRSDSFCNRSS